MRRIYLFVLSISFGAITLSGQDIEYARKALDSLCSEYMQGRGYVDNGHLKAANYLAREYKSWGLKPFKTGYFQEFRINVNTFPGKVKLMIGDRSLKPGQDFLVDPCSPFAAGDFSIVRISKKKAQNPAKLVKLFTGKKLKNKVVVFDQTEIDQTNKEEKARFNESISLLQHTPGVQPVAAVVLTNEKLTWHVAGYECTVPVFTVRKEKIDPDFNFVSLEVENALLKDQSTQNVIAYMEGKVQPDSFIVFSAHYDHLGRMGSEAWFPGANDDASGNAMLLNLAKYFADPDTRPSYSIVFMAFGAEEAGILGSEYFVKHPLFPIDRIKFLINLDIVGTGDEGITVVNGSIYQDQFDKLVSLNEEFGYFPTIKIRGKARNSDHYYFTEKGVPAFFIYTMGGTSAYHDIYDTPDQLPLTRFRELFKLLVEFVATF